MTRLRKTRTIARGQHHRKQVTARRWKKARCVAVKQALQAREEARQQAVEQAARGIELART